MDPSQPFEILKMIWPIIVLQLGFQIYALIDLIIVKKKRTKNLSAFIWGIIIVLGEIVGAAAYFVLGRSEE
ncbi:negative regulator of sigma-Y activity [Candidatus Saccharibacteria bacterium HGW-Saccharibacteria-1]|jgi:hypothetical protein|nr:MAG: negative regulator of sigma-Y activity [Candidatus Saccharibacteria bacterium HGW-Saccharibacteria-1]